MCNRYAYAFEWEALWAQLGLGGPIPTKGIEPRWNVAPTNSAPVLRANAQGHVLPAMLRWGFAPAWARARRPTSPLTNARREDIARRATFKDAYQQRRCLVPALAFFEWEARGRVRQPWCFALPKRAVMAFAGIWDVGEVDGARIETFAILTTRAVGAVARIHDRMPVLLRPAEVMGWLGSGPAIAPDAEQAAAALEAWPVSTRLNGVSAENDPGLLEPVQLTEVQAQRGLFDTPGEPGCGSKKP